MNNTDVLRFRTSLLRRSKASGCEGWMRVMRIAYSAVVPSAKRLGTKAGFIMFVGLFWFGVLASRADTHYVAQGGQTPYTNYTSWETAASNIQDAISVAIADDTVLVSNGVYETGGVTNWPAGTILTNRVAIDKAIIVRSANNDPTNTVIKGNWDPAINGPAAVRCMYMINGSSLIGFMLTNGATLTPSESAQANDQYGGGIYCPSTSPIISNCVIAGNSAKEYGGGAYYGTLYNCTLTGNSTRVGGGAGASTLYNCTLTGNSATYGGGVQGGILSNCTLTGNSAIAGGQGGGVNNSTLYNCTLTGNSSVYYSGGADGGTLYNCTLTGNSATNRGGGVHNGTLYNCTLTGNSSRNDIGGGANASTLYNCTLSGNSAGANGGGAAYSTLINCIVYFNTAATSGSNWYEIVAFTNSCTTPAATNGVGNITDDPRLVDKGSGYGTNHVAGNYRLAAGSPCRNTGTNFSWMTDPADPRSKDLDGNNRIDKYSGQVDMGCYEYLFKGTMIGIN